MAFASGIAVVVAITMGGVNAIVGTAISASLLPPVVNSGICLSLATIYWFMGWASDARAYAQYSVVSSIHLFVANIAYNFALKQSAVQVSFSLFLVNFVVIVAVGFVTFRYRRCLQIDNLMFDHRNLFRYIKRVHPSSESNDTPDTILSNTGGSPLHSNCSIDSNNDPKRDKIEMKSVLH